jgi:hypothetical protein
VFLSDKSDSPPRGVSPLFICFIFIHYPYTPPHPTPIIHPSIHLSHLSKSLASVEFFLATNQRQTSDNLGAMAGDRLALTFLWMN